MAAFEFLMASFIKLKWCCETFLREPTRPDASRRALALLRRSHICLQPFMPFPLPAPPTVFPTASDAHAALSHTRRAGLPGASPPKAAAPTKLYHPEPLQAQPLPSPCPAPWDGVGWGSAIVPRRPQLPRGLARPGIVSRSPTGPHYLPSSSFLPFRKGLVSADAQRRPNVGLAAWTAMPARPRRSSSGRRPCWRRGGVRSRHSATLRDTCYPANPSPRAGDTRQRCLIASMPAPAKGRSKYLATARRQARPGPGRDPHIAEPEGPPTPARPARRIITAFLGGKSRLLLGSFRGATPMATPPRPLSRHRDPTHGAPRAGPGVRRGAAR